VEQLLQTESYVMIVELKSVRSDKMNYKELVWKMFVAGVAGAAVALPYTLQPIRVILSAVMLAFIRGALIAGATYAEPKQTTGIKSKGVKCCNWATSFKKYV